MRPGIGPHELEVAAHAPGNANPKRVVRGIPRADDRGDVRKRGKRPHLFAAHQDRNPIRYLELVLIIAHPQVGPFRSEVSDLQAGGARHLALDVEIPILHVVVREIRVNAAGARGRSPGSAGQGIAEKSSTWHWRSTARRRADCSPADLPHW